MSRASSATLVKYLTCAFLPGSLLYLFIGFNQGMNVFDEGLIVYGADLLARGGTLYKDFWSGYGPAQFYLLATVFKVFGASIIVERVTTIVTLWLMSVAAYLIARRLVSPVLALLAWFLIVVRSFGVISGFPPPMPNVLLFSFLSCLCLLNFMSQRRVHWLLLSGLLAGVVTIFRHDFGVYTAFVGLLISTVFASKYLIPESKDIARRLLSIAALDGYYLLAAGIVMLPVAIWMLATVGKDEIVFALFLIPAKLYAKYYALPYPMPPNPISVLTGALSLRVYVQEIVLKYTPFWLPPIVFLFAAVLVAVRICTKDAARELRELLPTILVLILGLAFFNYARIRADFPHVLPALIVASILLSVILNQIPRAGKLRIPLGVLAFIVCLSIVYSPLHEKAYMAKKMLSPEGYALQLSGGKGICVGERGKAYEKAIVYVQQHVGKNEKIFVGNERHDIMRVNDAMFYFLASRDCATKYVELHRAVAPTAACQKTIVRDIETDRVRYVVLRRTYKYWEPNESSRSSGITILDRFIRAKFAPAATFGDYTVWKRKNDASSGSPADQHTSDGRFGSDNPLLRKGHLTHAPLSAILSYSKPKTGALSMDRVGEIVGAPLFACRSCSSS